MDFSRPVVGVVVALGVGAILFLLMKGDNNNSKKDDPAPAAKAKKAKPVGPFTKEEVAKHNTRDDVWLIIDNKVYDVTDYVDLHAGGDTILNNAGGDATAGVHGPQHPPSMWEVLEDFRIGDLKQ